MTLFAGGSAIFVWLVIVLSEFLESLCPGCPGSDWLEVVTTFAPMLVFGIVAIIGSFALIRRSWPGWWLCLAVNVVGLVWIIQADQARSLNRDAVPVVIAVWTSVVLCLLAPRTRAAIMSEQAQA